MATMATGRDNINSTFGTKWTNRSTLNVVQQKLRWLYLIMLGTLQDWILKQFEEKTGFKTYTFYADLRDLLNGLRWSWVRFWRFGASILLTLMASGPHCVWLPDVDVGLEYVVIACHCMSFHVIACHRWPSCDGLMFVDVCWSCRMVSCWWWCSHW